MAASLSSIMAGQRLDRLEYRTCTPIWLQVVVTLQPVSFSCWEDRTWFQLPVGVGIFRGEFPVICQLAQG